MKVILREDVENLGKGGEVVDVKPGYGRNFLLPRGLAVAANPKNVREVEHQKQVAAAKAAKLKASAQAVAKQQKALFMHCLYLGKPGLVTELERNLKMIDAVTRFQSVRLADEVDFDARAVEADVKVAPVEEERPREEGERTEEFEGEGAERGEE